MADNRKRIVIVEDEPDTIEMLAEMMRLGGYDVLKSYGGAPAMTLISEEKPDVVVLDMMMPEMSGMEVLRSIRTSPELKHIPVVIVSARSMPKDIKAGLDAGATAYLTKPVTFQQLNDAVHEIFESENSSQEGKPRE